MYDLFRMTCFVCPILYDLFRRTCFSGTSSLSMKGKVSCLNFLTWCWDKIACTSINVENAIRTGIKKVMSVHCPKSNPNFRCITWNIEENEVLQEIFLVLSRFPRYISCSITENRLHLGQCAVCRRHTEGYAILNILYTIQYTVVLVANFGGLWIVLNHSTLGFFRPVLICLFTVWHSVPDCPQVVLLNFKTISAYLESYKWAITTLLHTAVAGIIK